MEKKILFRFKKNERGVALIEFALIAPILVLLVMGVLEFGWLFNGWITITSAAREGARVASVIKVLPGEDGYDGYIEEAVMEHAKTLDNVIATPIAFSEKIKGTNYESIKVMAKGDLEPLVGFFISNTVTLTGEATMRFN